MAGTTWIAFVGSVRRFLFIAAVAFWLGGFTFYAGVVFHVGARALGSHMKQGFITQRVTDWLNIAGAAALPIMLWNLAAIWRVRGRMFRFALAASWGIMLLVQVELFALHPFMDRLLDARARGVFDYDRFESLHFAYITSSTVQWTAGLIHVWCSMAGTQV